MTGKVMHHASNVLELSALRVVSRVALKGVYRVYNLEVDGEHVYCVGSAGAVGHNMCPPRGKLVNVVEESSDRLGRWFVRYGDDGAETFSARLLNGTDELGVAWTDDVTQLAGNIAEIQGVIGRNIPKITGMASDGIEAAIKAGRFNSELYAKHLARRLGGQWRIDVAKRAHEDVLDISATRIGN